MSLSGVGRFTIVDSAKVSERDLANNFFVTEAELGKNRAEVVAAWLHEINPDVKHVDPLVKVRLESGIGPCKVSFRTEQFPSFLPV